MACNEAHYKELLASSAHRGPDEVWLSRWRSLYFGCNRLSIVDLGVSLCEDSESISTAVLFNGEIWNYEEIVNTYQLQDCISERNAILKLFEHLGPDFIRELDGVFAIAIIDKLTDRLYLYRDPIGVKPLFYLDNCDEGRFIFSSDVKTICLWDSFTPTFNTDAMTNELVVGFSDYDDCLFSGIRQIPPSHYVVVDMGSQHKTTRRCTLSRYESTIASLVCPRANDQSQLSILQEAVSRQYHHCDRRPIGLLLSGGIDSSLLAFLARSLNLNEIVCFHCGKNGSADQLWAQKVAEVAGYELKTFSLSAEKIWEELDANCYYMSGGHSLLYNMFRHVRALSPHLRVLWSGEGADELYGGYDHYSDPSPVFANILNRAPSPDRWTSLVRKIDRIYESTQRGMNRHDLAQKLLTLDREEQLVNNHLLPHDQAAMASSFEIRLPFLDLRNVAYAKNIPVDLILGDQRKAQLKRILCYLSGISDREFYERPKQSLPNAFGDELAELKRIAFAHATKSQPYLNPARPFFSRCNQITRDIFCSGQIGPLT